jgi:hypothetical protein
MSSFAAINLNRHSFFYNQLSTPLKKNEQENSIFYNS